MHDQPIPDPIAERIAALLDKAESTSYPAEADAFMAKAQELMARHAIDEAMLQPAQQRRLVRAWARLPVLRDFRMRILFPWVDFRVKWHHQVPLLFQRWWFSLPLA